ncbi:MAG: AMP-binding protein [Clostridia bacterium]|nr:AMP-binding protein [Clostridia bacterium]
MSKNFKKEIKQVNNLKDVIYNSVNNYGNNIAFVIKHWKDRKNFEYENITYKRFLEDINKFGTGLYKKGLKGKKIAIIGKNRYEWVVAHFANLLGGIVSVPLDKDLQYEELESSLIRAKVDAIVFDEKLTEMISKIRTNERTNIKDYISMDNLESFESFSAIIEEGKEEIEKGNKEYIEFEIENDVMNILLFTSGTTSQSKAVMLSQRNVASNIYAMQHSQDVRSTDTNIAFLPFHHIFGSTCIAMMISCGVKTVFPDGLRYIKQNLNEYKVSIFVGVPVLVEAIYKTVMKEIDKQGKTKLIKFALVISNLLMKLHIDVRRKLFKQIINALGGEFRHIISGGAPADPKISKGFNDFGIKVVQGYGLSETAPVIAAENDDNIEFGTVGVPMMNDTIEIVNPDEKGIGEIRVKGPNVFLGYYEMPEKTAEVLKDGWLYTGDLGCFNKRGRLIITGRDKNLIVLKNGKKVFPEELELLVNRLDVVEECMVFGMPDEKDKNDLTVSVKVVYNKDIAKEKYPNAKEDELYKIIWEQVKEINKTFPKYKHIQKMILTDQELIKTTTKKVKRFEEMKLILGK